MSKYKIYRIDSSDPGKIGKRSKRLITWYSILLMLLYFAMNSDLVTEKLHFSKLAYHVSFSLIILLTLILVYIISRQIKKLKKIGTLEFTQTKIKKEIADLRTEIQFDTISRIEVNKHIRALTVFQSNTGSVTYIIRIIYNDLKEDLFIISEKSEDYGQNVSLINTLNTIKRIASLDLVINNT